MNALLPAWASYVGTLIGIAVLLSACAAAAQGIQNLSLGLRYRHYVSADLGQRNKHDVAGKPVWIMVVVIALCFVLFGTHEETYLALYAAGVFILLSMTGWAACKTASAGIETEICRRKTRFVCIGTAVASVLTSIATLIIFEERFFEGAWSYLIMVPLFISDLHIIGTNSVRRLRLKIGSVRSFPNSVICRLFCRKRRMKMSLSKKSSFRLNGTSLAEQVLATARSFARSYNAKLNLSRLMKRTNLTKEDQTEYLEMVSDLITADGLHSELATRKGEPATEIDNFAEEINADLIIMTTRGKFSVDNIITDSIAQKVVKKTLTPTLADSSDG